MRKINSVIVDLIIFCRISFFMMLLNVVLKIFLDSGGSAILLGQDTISLAMVSVQEQVKKYLEAEENAMNERIRYFSLLLFFQ